ncbi:hypothetical protein BaRGS_00028143 [Batillaria attramentaria]|uniref:Uncharacterized protein n=1 Tax=Batillaria attramentaria TaxID=370345 RepID=A0ABD0K0H4_9CAEN
MCCRHTGDVLYSTRHGPQVPFDVTEGVDYDTIFTEGPLPVSATRLDIGSCQNDTVPVYSDHLGEIQGGARSRSSERCGGSLWSGKITVPDHLFLSVLFDVLEPCDSDTFLVLPDVSGGMLPYTESAMTCYFTSRLYFLLSNEIRLT